MSIQFAIWLLFWHLYLTCCRQEWCPVLHTVQGNDPSGPVKVGGVWHVFPTDTDYGSWGHFTSTDLVTWQKQAATDFSDATGSIGSVNGADFVAFWPNTSVPFPCCDIDRGATTLGNLSSWIHTGRAIARPTDLSLHQGFRDPHRPLKVAGKWRIGVGSGSGADESKPLVGRIRWFTALDKSLQRWEDSGILFEVNQTHGYTDPRTMEWNATWNRELNMIECPDVFTLGSNDEAVVLGSLQYDGPWQGTSTTWWVGRMDSTGAHFTAGTVGLVDYGQLYAGRSGTDVTLNGTSRRLLFGFTGWQAPTLEPGCGDYHGMYHVLPRELSIAEGRLQIRPVAEVALLRGTRVASGVADLAKPFVAGAQTDIEVRCNFSGSALPTTGSLHLELLADAEEDGAALIVGYDFAEELLFVDHSRIGDKPIRQTAPLSRTHLAGAATSLRVVADRAMIETFAGEAIAITSFVTATGSAAPEHRVARCCQQPAKGVTCVADAWTLAFRLPHASQSFVL